eukprot:scaffold120942_cov36-Prasinocladus_malaysianus.AAC.1
MTLQKARAFTCSSTSRISQSQVSGLPPAQSAQEYISRWSVGACHRNVDVDCLVHSTATISLLAYERVHPWLANGLIDSHCLFPAQL